MSTSLEDRFTAVGQAGSREDLLNELVRFTRWLGFETVSATAVTDDAGEVEFVAIDNTPASYFESFACVENGRCDPVMQHCRRARIPIVWNQETYTSRGLGAKWEHQAQFGYQTGIALALHMPAGRHFFLGVDRDQALPASQREVTRMAADLQLFAVHALDSAVRVLFPPTPAAGSPRMTARELDCLRWTMDGKTAWEVGRILGISEQTAVRHLSNASRKLDCVNKHQAVVKALRLGLLR